MLKSKKFKPRKCVVCKTEFIPRRIGLKITKVCLNAACVLDYAQGIKVKELKRQEREQARINAKQKREFYDNDVPKQLELCKKVFNRMRVLQELKWFADRGLEPTCISCGKPKGGDIWACGHFKTVGSQGSLRFDPKNTYLQHNKRCNMDLSGDIYGTNTTHGYLQGLRNRFGIDEGNAIIEYCEKNTKSVKWIASELKSKRAEWAAEIRKLEKELSL